MSKHLLLYFALFLWWVVPSSAQLTLSFPDLNTNPQEEIDVDLTVENYTDIITIQFTYRWDPEVLQFVDTLALNFKARSNLLLNLNDIDDGFFRLYWFDPTLVGESIEDEEPLVQVRFKAIGDDGTSSPLIVSDDPMPFLAGDIHTTGEIPTARNNGMVTVGEPNGVNDPEAWSKMQLLQNQPNPFREKTLIQFDLTEAEYITFSVLDLLGQKVFEQTRFYPAGSQYITLEQHQLPTAGTYVYQIQAGKHLLTKKLTMVR